MDIARILNLTRSAVSVIVAELIQLGLVRESHSGPATGGRRAILLEMNPKHGYVVGVDMGASHLMLVAADFLGRVVHEVELPFDILRGPEASMVELDGYLKSFLEQAKLPLNEILSIGMGVPGPVVVESGMVSAPPIMPGWDGFPIRENLEKRWEKPLSLNNDADLGALGEWAYGAGRFTRDMIYLKVGTGIGAGLILDGRMYFGASGLAGEIGHLTIEENGPVCSCGNRGCLEALAGGAAIARRAIQAVRSGRNTLLASTKPIEKITAREVGEAARLGDLIAQQIVAEAGVHIGTAMAGIINLINPSVIVVGGGVAQMGDLLLEPIRRAVSERSLRPAWREVRVTAAMLGRRSSGMGAIAQAIDAAILRQTREVEEKEGGDVKKERLERFSSIPNPSDPVIAGYNSTG